MATESTGMPPIETGDAGEYHRRGWSLYVQGDYERAEADFRQAIALDPGAVDSHYGLALLLKARGSNAESSEHFRKVIELVEGGALAEQRERAVMLRHLAQTHLDHISAQEWKAP
ncbi:MAG: tetratricopeptide repeat protein [Chloroflexi bacterium]|jgi:tetratricopeptide (TPR) repeat protein|nr:tetratricopeptide repeat protein [Chloroflexota bacterium]